MLPFTHARDCLCLCSIVYIVCRSTQSHILCQGSLQSHKYTLRMWLPRCTSKLWSLSQKKMQTFAVCVIVRVMCDYVCMYIQEMEWTYSYVRMYVRMYVRPCMLTLVMSRDITSDIITITLHYIACMCVCVCVSLCLRVWVGGSCIALLPNARQCMDFRDIWCKMHMHMYACMQKYAKMHAHIATKNSYPNTWTQLNT